MSGGPLAGLRILSLAEQYPGPYATLILADLGADIIMIERPRSGDPGRAYPSFFRTLARNKRSVTLNLKHDADRERFLDLAKSAEAVLEGFRPGVMARLRLSNDVLWRVNPRLVVVSITSFGQTGPLRDRVTHDHSVQAIAGLLADADTGRAPAGQLALADISSAMFATTALLAGVREAARTGTGRHYDVGMADCLVSWLTPLIAARANGDAPLTSDEFPAYGIFECADGNRVSLSVTHEDHFWVALCEVIGLEDCAGMKQEARAREADALYGKLAVAIRARSTKDWAEVFDATGIPWSPVNTLEEVLTEPQFQTRDMFGRFVRKGYPEETFVRQPIRFASASEQPLRHAPDLGEHNHELIVDSEN